MKNKCLIVVVLLFAFIETRTCGAAYVHPINQMEEQTSETTICADVIEKLQQDSVYVDEVSIKFDKTGKILFRVTKSVKTFLGESDIHNFVSFKRFVELNHKNHKILQVQFNFNINVPNAHVFYEKFPNK